MPLASAGWSSAETYSPGLQQQTRVQSLSNTTKTTARVSMNPSGFTKMSFASARPTEIATAVAPRAAPSSLPMSTISWLPTTLLSPLAQLSAEPSTSTARSSSKTPSSVNSTCRSPTTTFWAQPRVHNRVATPPSSSGCCPPSSTTTSSRRAAPLRSQVPPLI